MKQFVNEPTHVRGHTLDVVITRDTSNILSSVSVTDPGLCDHFGNIKQDHFAVTFSINSSKPPPIRKLLTYMNLRAIDIDILKEHFSKSDWIMTQCSKVGELLDIYTNELTKLIDKHAPICSKTITLLPQLPWFTDDLNSTKHQKRKLECNWQENQATY